MADEQSISALQEIEKHFQRLMDLLNQADQALQEFRVSNDVYQKAHHENQHKAQSIDEAITRIEKVLAEATNIHNDAVGHVREAQAEAANRPADEGT